MARLQNENSYISILNSIRSSSYNYSFKETPYSIYLTLRKSIRNPPNSDFSYQAPLHQTTPELNPENEIVTANERVKSLEYSNQTLSKDLEEASIDNEVKQETIENLTSKLEILHQKLAAAEKVNEIALASKLKAIEAEKRLLENKHVKACSEIKVLKNEREEHVKEINRLKVTLKSARKETKDGLKQFEKEIHDKENKIKDLQNYRTYKTMEEKDLKVKTKKVEKKLKMIKEKEAKLDLEKRGIEKLKHQSKIDWNVTNLELDPNGNLIADDKFDDSSHFSSRSSESPSSSLTPSMVSNWLPASSYSFQNPGSIPSMITHVVKLPSPGSTLLTMEEVLEEIQKMLDKFLDKKI